MPVETAPKCKLATRTL